MSALLLALAACREDQASLPPPVDLTAEAVGFYCQMELLEHDGPKGQVHLDGLPAPLFFSQVRDTLAYLRMPEQSHAVRAAYVQDMTGADWATPGDWITLQDAFFVLGSDRLGGMGAPEIVPFSDVAAAQDFAAHHGGEVRPFEEIGPQDILTAPETGDADDISLRLDGLRAGGGTN